MKFSLAALSRSFAGVALAALAVAVHADPYQFTLTNSAYSASWILESSPTVSLAQDGQSFTVFPGTGTFPGMTADQVSVSFAGKDQNVDSNYPGLGITILDWSTFDWVYFKPMEQVYTGSELSPTFRLGQFQLIDQSHGDLATTLTITAVPEPASMAMLLAGLGLVGVVAARRPKV